VGVEKEIAGAWPMNCMPVGYISLYKSQADKTPYLLKNSFVIVGCNVAPHPFQRPLAA